MKKLPVLLLFCGGAGLSVAAPSTIEGVRNVVVYREAGRYGGWPANHGIWIWGNEILVGFERGYFKYSGSRHSIDWDRPAEHVLARSLDGGETWTLEHPASLRPPPNSLVAHVHTEPGGKETVDCPGGIDFTNPNFAFTARMEDVNVGPSRFYYSYDRGKNWNGPFRIPNFGQKGIAARTDYLINGKHDMTMFLTAAKSNGKEGRVICVRTQDGGKTWRMLSFIGPEPGTDDMAIMPSSIRLSSGAILTSIRHTHWIELYHSDDDGKSWTFLNRPADTGAHGNPPRLFELKDGNLAITYGYRSAPYSIRTVISKDQGKTWSHPVTLRNDGGTWDLGYTRSVVRPDGKVVTVYYFNDDSKKERFIGASIWDPQTIEKMADRP
ncbi:MAG TPA: sialidase family protein [Bryobacteraceae bacterium]